jgi:hypothetical protein
VSTIFELSATWISPRLIRRIGTVRAGTWSLSWQIIWLAAGVSWFIADWADNKTSSILSVVGGVILSRVGLWGYDLAAQISFRTYVTFNIPLSIYFSLFFLFFLLSFTKEATWLII